MSKLISIDMESGDVTREIILKVSHVEIDSNPSDFVGMTATIYFNESNDYLILEEDEVRMIAKVIGRFFKHL